MVIYSAADLVEPLHHTWWNKVVLQATYKQRWYCDLLYKLS